MAFTRILLAALVAGGVWSLGGCASVRYADDEYRIHNGALMKGSNAFTMEAIHVPELGASGGTLSAMVPALARIAEHGGNTVAFDLAGLNEDGTTIDMAGVETVSAIAERVKGQRMYAVVRVVGPEGDDAYRRAAVTTAARALADEGRVAYWIDGPDSAALADLFRRHARGRVVAAEANGDIQVLREAPASQPEGPALVVGPLPDLDAVDVHFVLPADDASYDALEAAKITPKELEPWTPDNSVLSEEEREEGFIALFNGRDLDGWWVLGGGEEAFAVNDGVVETVDGSASALMTVNRYDNYILRLEYKIEDGCNSGIFLRAPRSARHSRIGMEFQLRGDYGAEPTDDQTGAIYAVLAPTVNAGHPSLEWNDVEIVLDGSKFRATLNGELIQDVDLDDHEELRYRLRRGFIGLQDHTGYVGFRNVRIKPL